MLTPIELIKATVDGMAARGFGRIVNITSSSVKSPIDILGLSNGARSGLTGFVAGVARTSKLAGGQRHHQQPAARRLRHRPPARRRMEGAAKKTGKTVERSAEARMKTIPAQRLGTPEEFGAACAFLCSQQASYITGQNVLIDGGAYPGTY
jgi:3-oxoacyl-[acyl-carrier protein] reductase